MTRNHPTLNILIIINHSGEKTAPWVVRTFLGPNLFLKHYPNKKAALSAANLSIAAEAA